MLVCSSQEAYAWPCDFSGSDGLSMNCLVSKPAQEQQGGDLPLVSLWAPRGHGGPSFFHPDSFGLLRWPYTYLGWGQGTNHREVPTHPHPVPDRA